MFMLILTSCICLTLDCKLHALIPAHILVIHYCFNFPTCCLMLFHSYAYNLWIYALLTITLWMFCPHEHAHPTMAPTSILVASHLHTYHSLLGLCVPVTYIRDWSIYLSMPNLVEPMHQCFLQNEYLWSCCPYALIAYTLVISTAYRYIPLLTVHMYSSYFPSFMHSTTAFHMLPSFMHTAIALHMSIFLFFDTVKALLIIISPSCLLSLFPIYVYLSLIYGIVICLACLLL